jgi:hypothetical protein
VTERPTGEELWRRRRLENAGFVLAEGPEGEKLWREPGTGRLLPEGRVEELVRQREERELRESGWEPVEVESVTYWRNPRSGYLYPRQAAHGVVSGDAEGGQPSGR